MSLKGYGLRHPDGRLKQIQKYTDGRTKQSFKDECDIKKIMARAEKAGTMSHLEKFQGVYADYSDVDFHQLTDTLRKGREVFDELPAEIRNEFNQSPQQFFAYVNNPANKDKLLEKLPALAAPGRQLPKITPPSADEEAVIAASSEPASVTTTTQAPADAVEPTATPEVA